EERMKSRGFAFFWGMRFPETGREAVCNVLITLGKEARQSGDSRREHARRSVFFFPILHPTREFAAGDSMLIRIGALGSWWHCRFRRAFLSMDHGRNERGWGWHFSGLGAAGCLALMLAAGQGAPCHAQARQPEAPAHNAANPAAPGQLPESPKPRSRKSVNGKQHGALYG